MPLLYVTSGRRRKKENFTLRYSFVVYLNYSVSISGHTTSNPRIISEQSIAKDVAERRRRLVKSVFLISYLRTKKNYGIAYCRFSYQTSKLALSQYN
jgi:hypothetical protein